MARPAEHLAVAHLTKPGQKFVLLTVELRGRRDRLKSTPIADCSLTPAGSL
jgi:hypothetical protein